MKNSFNLLLIIAFQLSGDSIQRNFHTPIPGAIIGMSLFFLYLVLTKGGGKSLQFSGSQLLNHLPLFFIPAGAGLIAYSGLLLENFWAISVALILGTLLTFTGTLLLMQHALKSPSKN